MMINKRVQIVVMAGIAILALTACQHAGRWHRAEADHFAHANRYLTRELDLDQQQQQLLAALLTGFEAQRDPLLNGERLYAIYTHELSKEELDTARLQRATTAMIRDLEIASDRSIAQLAAFHQTLSRDQKQRLARLLENRREGAQRRHRQP
jgi:uncharacterized membrane protein